MADSAAKPTTLQLMAYAAPSLPLAGFGLPLAVHLPNYYAEELGLPLVAVGLAFMWVKLIDIAADPVIGALMDRTRTRLGRFRAWLVAAAPVLMLSAFMLFMARPGVSAVYLWLWLLVAYVGFSMGSLAQTAWGAVLSPDYDQRSRIYGWWQAGNVVGMLLLLLLPVVMQLGLGASRQAGMQAMGWYVVALLPLGVALAVWRTPEPERPRESAARISDYLALFRFGSVRRILLIDILMAWAPALTAALFFFYFQHIKGIPQAQSNLLLLVYFAAGLAGAPLWSWLAQRLGKHRAMAAVALTMAAGIMVLHFTPLPNLWVAGAVLALGGLPFSGSMLILRSMLADVGDEIRLETGVDRTGLLYSILTATLKTAQALAVGCSYVGLQLAGFHAGQANPPQALLGLQLLFVGLPVAISLLAAASTLGYRLDARRHAAIREALERRDAPSPA
ncbi:MAG TPA: MFS transporter [Caulobacteraceae bacterium]|jgi:Na+/melibiose symporter-like transporter